MIRYFVLLCTLLFIGCRQRPAPPAPVLPVPSNAQLEWHKMEMNAFVHFSMNTFTNKEWGYGDEDRNLFMPDSLNADQWMKVFKETGFKAVILTCKHHDGFCLWPTKTSEHSVANTAWREGKGDVVKEVSEAAKRQNLKFGVYLSPWDRNQSVYGQPDYVNVYRNQLTEIFTSYGPVFEMWFDGANGGDGYYGGARETRKIQGATYYDWPGTIKLVRSWTPDIIFFSDAGPGVRWVGNERGVAGETNWNMITPDTLFAGKAGLEPLLNQGHQDGTHWIPAETDVSIRPGWFYHPEEDSKVKSPQELFNIYLTSVGRGSTLLLNVPPNRHGLLHSNDVASLKGFRSLLDSVFSTSLTVNATVTVSNTRGNSAIFGKSNMTDKFFDSYWATDDTDTTGWIELSWPTIINPKFVVIQEYIPLGQRVSKFQIEASLDGEWSPVVSGTTIGYKRIVKLPDNLRTTGIKLRVLSARGPLALASLDVY